MNDTPNVLLVEDDAALASLVERGLTQRGFRVTRAPSAEVALEVAREQRFETVVSDVRMDRMTGLELCERLILKVDRKTLYTRLKAYGWRPSDPP